MQFRELTPADLPGELVEFVSEIAGGVPLQIEEVVHELIKQKNSAGEIVRGSVASLTLVARPCWMPQPTRGPACSGERYKRPTPRYSGQLA